MIADAVELEIEVCASGCIRSQHITLGVFNRQRAAGVAFAAANMYDIAGWRAELKARPYAT
jgi:hypothetical protein